MAEDEIRYYRVKRNGRAFWQPTPTMKAHGFMPVPLGKDGPEAKAKALRLNDQWDAARTGRTTSPAMVDASNLSPHQIEELTVYPHGSIGEAFRRYRRIEEWHKKQPATREEWFRAWQLIKPIFGDVKPSTVSLEDISAWRQTIEETISLREAHRSVKIWRALWKIMAALKYCVRDADPSLGVRNNAAPGRSQTWSEGEAVRLVKRAWRMGFYGLAAAIAVAWDTQFSPGDIRLLVASQMASGADGAVFFTARGKTGVPVGGALSARSLRVLAAYVAKLPVELLGDAYLFRNRSGTHYLADRLGRDFRLVRTAEFGPAETRMLGHDFRRSGAVEAIAGEATAEAVAHAMGNTLSASNALFATYVPINPATLMSVVEARRRGRNKLR